MKKVIRIILWIVVAIVFIAGIAAFSIRTFFPRIPVADIKVELTPQRIERGKYLANHVTVCIDCHSGRDWSKFSGPIKPGTEGMGGEQFDQRFGFPGKFISPNITPSNLKSWTDGEIYRAITSGVNKQGDPLFPVMPYPHYGKMDKEDIYSIIAYIRTLQPRENTTPDSKADFPVSYIMHLMPEKANHEKTPAKSDTLNYGRYLVNAGSCIDCHTRAEKGQIVESMAFAGGREFPMSFGSLFSPNITFDKETGIGNWSKTAFINRFKMYRSSTTDSTTVVKESEYNSLMPWNMFAGMTDDDLGAIYTYLRSVQPIKNSVTKVKMRQTADNL